MSTTSFADLGVVPPAPGLSRGAHWRVMLLAANGSAVTHLFNEEPEHRAVEALLAHHGANGAMVMPPICDTEEA
jgi:hypothetical protein